VNVDIADLILTIIRTLCFTSVLVFLLLILWKSVAMENDRINYARMERRRLRRIERLERRYRIHQLDKDSAFVANYRRKS